jgi:hypothetical protein
MRLLVLLLITFATTAFGQPAAQRKVMQAEQRRFEAMVQRDTQSLAQLVDKTLIFIHSNALKETKTDFIGSVSSGRIIYQSMKPTPVAFQRWGRTAILNGTVAVEGIYKGNPFKMNLLYTSVYRKKGGHWRLVRWQSTKEAT